MRLKPKRIGEELSLDDYNAYQYLLYKSEDWKDDVKIDMEEPYKGDFASYLLKTSDLLLNDKQDTYKVKTELNANSKLEVILSDIPEFYDLKHTDFSVHLRYKESRRFLINADNVGIELGNDEEVTAGTDEEIVEFQPSDSIEVKDWSTEESHKMPNLDEDYEHITLPCSVDPSALKLTIPLYVDGKAVFKKNTLISKFMTFHVRLDRIPYIDIRNGVANDPYEICLNSFDQLQNIIKYAPDDGTATIIRLDSNKGPYYFPETLRIKDGQNIEIRGGTAEWIHYDEKKNEKIVQIGRTILDGSVCNRLFIVEFGGKLTLNNMYLRNCNCTGVGNYDRGRGGAILVESIRRDDGVPKFGILNCNNCTFYLNKAWYGGAIFSYHAGLFLDTCDFIENYAGINGGAVYYWARDVKLEFPNLTTENGKTIYLKVRVLDYLSKPVTEGEIDFYIKQDKEEIYLDTVNVNEYTKLKIKEKSGLATVPTTGCVKDAISGTSVEAYETVHSIIVGTDSSDKYRLPIIDGGKLKPCYNSNFEAQPLGANEMKVNAVFLKEYDNDPLPEIYNSKDKYTYLDYTNPNVLKHLIYYDEITGVSYIPNDVELKKSRTDPTNESRYSIITRDGVPVTVEQNGELFLKELYNDSFDEVPLEEGEEKTLVVFKERIGEDTLPKRYNQAKNSYALDYKNSDLLKHLVYYPLVDVSKMRGWVSLPYTIPEENTKSLLQFVAHYKAGATYDDEVITNMVTVIFPETYKATFTSSDKGVVGSTMTITVKVVNEQDNIVSSPKGIFTVGSEKINAQHDGENYYFKYKVEDFSQAKITIKFNLEESPHYKCPEATQVLIIDEGSKEEDTGEAKYITAMFVGSKNVRLKAGSKTEYEDTGITDDVVNAWVNAGITDLFVYCNDYENAEKRAVLTTVLDKVDGKKVGGKDIRVHAVIDCFYDSSGGTMAKMWANINPSSTARRTFVTKQIELLLKKTKIHGICFNYCRFQGSETNLSWNGNVAIANRKAHVTSAVKLFNDTVEKINKKIYTSVTVMPEEDADLNYGQSFKDIGGIVDYVMPYTMKGDYIGVSKNKDSWVVDIINFIVNQGVSKDKMISVIQTYTDYSDLERKANAGKTSEAFRTKSDLEATVTEIAKTKIKGYCLHRAWLIKEYPKNYDKAMGGK